MFQAAIIHAVTDTPATIIQVRAMPSVVLVEEIDAACTEEGVFLVEFTGQVAAFVDEDAP